MMTRTRPTQGMMEPTRWILLSMLCLLPVSILAVQKTDARQSSLGLDEVEISSLGAVRLSEMFRMMPGMETWSNDRYTQRLIGSGLGGVHSSGPTILIDGGSYPAFFMDRTLTETLPVSPSDLASVRWEPGRRVVEGGRVADGLLRLETKPVKGWTARASIGLINETGDPGPAKLLDSTATNVDRSGPALDARLAWGNGMWTAIAGLQTDLHHLTDERISGRVRRVYAAPVQPVVTQFSPHIRLTRRSTSSDFDLAVGSSRRKDLLFHESAGWEWPVRYSRDWGRVRLDQRVAPFWRAGFDAEGQRVSTSNRSAFIELPSAFTFVEASSEGWIRMGSSTRSLTFGAGFRVHQFDQSDLSVSQSGLFARVQSDVRGAYTAWTTSVLVRQADDFRADASTPSSGRAFDIAVTSSLSHQSLSNRHIDLELSWMRGRFLENGSFENLVLIGFDPAQWISALETPSTQSREQEFGATLQGSLPLTASLRAWARLEGRWMTGGNLIDRIINQPFGIGPLLPESAFAAERHGWLFSRSLGLDRVSGAGPGVRFYYQFMHVSSMGDDVFFRNITGFPRHRLVAMVSDQRDGGLSWNIRFGMTSPWTWPEYIEPARKRIPVEVLLDATVGKDLLGARMKALVSFLNIPDATLGHHPAGVVEQFAVRLTLRLGLGSR